MSANTPRSVFIFAGIVGIMMCGGQPLTSSVEARAGGQKMPKELETLDTSCLRSDSCKFDYRCVMGADQDERKRAANRRFDLCQGEPTTINPNIETLKALDGALKRGKDAELESWRADSPLPRMRPEGMDQFFFCAIVHGCNPRRAAVAPTSQAAERADLNYVAKLRQSLTAVGRTR